MFFGLMKQMLNYFEMISTKHGTKKAAVYQHQSSIPVVKYGGGSIMIGACSTTRDDYMHMKEVDKHINMFIEMNAFNDKCEISVSALLLICGLDLQDTVTSQSQIRGDSSICPSFIFTRFYIHLHLLYV